LARGGMGAGEGEGEFGFKTRRVGQFRELDPRAGPDFLDDFEYVPFMFVFDP